MTDLKKYLPNEGEILEVAKANEIHVACLIMRVVRQKLDTEMRHVIQDGQVSDRIADDFRSKIGFCAALDWMLHLPDEAQEWVRNAKQ